MSSDSEDSEGSRIRVDEDGVTVEPEPVDSGLLNPNAVSTTRYTWVTWLPKSLYHQFNRIANIYFVIVAALACTPLWGGRWESKVCSVLFILLVQAFKDLYEDRKRYHDDLQENTLPCSLWSHDTDSFETVERQSLAVGDLVMVTSKEGIPADLLIISSSEVSGECFVSTKSLDGETNLKQRLTPAMLLNLIGRASNAERAANAFFDFTSQINLKPPAASLLDMDNSLTVNCRTEGVNLDHFVLRGCQLENTGWILGLVCYTGDSTKVRMNASAAPTKISNLEKYLNRCVMVILALIIIGSLYFTICSLFYPLKPWYVVFVKYFVSLYVILPMSLYVMFEFMHLFMGYQINTDKLMYDKATDAYAKARNTNVSEEMGQVDFVFSDKTGTLTANEMRWAYCCVGANVVGPFLPEPGAEGAAPGWAEAKRMLQGGPEQKQAKDFFEALAVCHTVQVSSDSEYQGESPDEVALVEAAAGAGQKLIARKIEGNGTVVSVQSAGGTEDYRVVHVIPFSSDRKRMSVVCALRDGRGLVMTKGADSIMEKLLAQPMPSGAYAGLQHFARAGLRTLVVGTRQMDAGAYRSFAAQWTEAQSKMSGRDAAVAAVAAVAETGLNYVGVTALEDRLQDGVPETIANLREAGIRVWVLTGDKVETAVEIAKSCRLFAQGVNMVRIVNNVSTEECMKTMDETLSGCTSQELGLVLDGQSITYILGDGEARETLYKLAKVSSSCICCRLSPLQKREIVELVREQNPKAITLAIGDGANDVPMIQGAHVGVGIRGREGGASVQASDIAISQFRYLANLLFCHGRGAYRRLSTYLLYFIYKNVVLAVGYIIWAHTIFFAGSLAYPEWLDAMYNNVTSVAVVIILLYDTFYSDEVAVKSPELYWPGPARLYLNRYAFLKWMSIGVCQGALAWCLPIYVLTTYTDRHEQTQAFWEASWLVFCSVVVIIHIKLLCMAECPIHLYGWIIFVLELVGFVVLTILLSTPPLGPKLAPMLVGAPLKVMTSWKHIACLVGVTIAALILDLLICGISRLTCRATSRTPRLRESRGEDSSSSTEFVSSEIDDESDLF